MKEFIGLELCNYHSRDFDRHVRADLVDGELHINCQDLGDVCEEVWGDSDYEFFYSFDRKETEKLIKAIDGEEDPEEALIREFAGLDGDKHLRECCKKNGVRYRFYSYV